MQKNKGIIYYTDNRLSEPIFSIVQKFILKANLPITSVSHKPMNFGDNYVFDGTPGIVSMIKQIHEALSRSKEKYVFFCEHDVLYPKSHFDFTPTMDNVFFYNDNVLRWKYPTNTLITYDRLINLSCLCVNRIFALAHYQKRLDKIKELGYDKIQSRDPLWARRWGHEPGTKRVGRGGFSNDNFSTFHSTLPIIDIRHKNTYSPIKVTLDSFKHLPTGWNELTLDGVPGWKLKELFGIDINN